MDFLKKISQILVTLILAILALQSCMVGPNFRRPNGPQVSTFTAFPLPPKTVSIPTAGKGGRAQRFIPGEDIPPFWWHMFHSPEIDCLVRRGIANSPTLESAQATLRQAQETLYAQIGSTILPQIDGQFTAQRQRFSSITVGGGAGGATSANIFNVFNTQLNISYTLDVWGGLRRQIESVAAQVDYERYLMIGTYLTLTSNIVTTAISVASFREQIKATLDLIKAESDQLVILRKQFSLGGISKATVYTQEVLVANSKATLPVLQKSLSQSEHALAVLVGTLPNEKMPAINLEALTLPGDIPVSVPSCLVRQRPDVLASEALLHQATAQIGVATANLLPQFNITGYYGWTSLTLPELFSPKNLIWSMATNVTQPIFNGGALFAQRRAAIYAARAACANYRETVLQAFQNVADSLRALETDARTLLHEKQAETSAKNGLDLVQTQYFLGGTSYLALLIAQQQYQTARINRIRAQATRYTDTAALFQALGGGWWNCPDIACGTNRAACQPCPWNRRAM